MSLSLLLRYDQREDRMLLIASGRSGGPASSFWLSRRPVSKLIVWMRQGSMDQDREPLASGLEQGVAERQQAALSRPQPADPSAPLRFEAASVVQAALEHPATLVQEIRVGQRNGQAVLSIIRGSESPFVIVLSDEERLRLLDLLYRRALEADWGLQDAVPWLKQTYFGQRDQARRAALN